MPAFIYQILNHYTAPSELDAGFLLLDNSANERPDWFEYWPMRKYLLHESLDEEAFYGFVSPKFRVKTNLSAAQVHAFILGADAGTDVILFSPGIQNSAHFLNVFEHGDAKHPGLLNVAQQLFFRINRPTTLGDLVTDSRNEVFSNYFVAKPRFWREWMAINEALFAFAEDPADPLGAQLRTCTSYRSRSSVPMKIFVMERIATWLLATDRRFVARAYDSLAPGRRPYRAPVAIACDALKIAYIAQGRKSYKDVFLMIQKLRSMLTWQTRWGAALGSKPIRRCLRHLASYWRERAR